ncbi:sensor histidine kinase [Azospirillum sp. SYSU D00513]|uniref:sensor histidine kinase n=1 Tax=Azospirillum sp. SYSU D00513 TaxID=2812561 RepID=UPI001A97243C|nr:sensor histidine kinase [Azospirillum sp. SYSU D00513]
MPTHAPRPLPSPAPGHHRLPGTSLVVIACVAAILLTVGLSALFAWRDRDTSYRQATDLAGNVSLLVAEHAARLVETSDLILRQAVELGGPAGAPVPADRAAWERLRALAGATPYMVSLRLTDAEGATLMTSRRFPAGTDGARPGGLAAQAGPPDAAANGPFIGRIDGEDATDEPQILLSRPLAAAPGEFRGLAVATVSPRYLRDIYKAFDIGHERIITLEKADGTLLVSEPPAALPAREDTAISVTRPVEGRDVVARVTVPSVSVGAHWRARLWAYATYAAAAMGAVALIGALAIQRARRQREAEDALQVAYATLEERVHQRTAELEAVNASLERAVEDKEVLLKEVQHRVKNNLQVICSLLRLQGSRIDERARYGFDESLRRIQSMSLVHELLYRSEQPARINLADYLHQLCDGLVRSANPTGARLVVEARDWTVDADRAMPLALMTSELVSNALRHAFPQGHPGTVMVGLEPAGDGMVLTVRDDGVGLPPENSGPRPRGLGLVLVRSLAQQAAATVHIGQGNVGQSSSSQGGPGTVFTLTIPTSASRRSKAA